MGMTLLDWTVAAPSLIGSGLRSHENSSRKSRLDLILLEAFFDATAKFPGNRELLSRTGFYEHEIFRFAIADTIDSRHLDVSDDIVRELGIVPDFLSDLLQQFDNFIAGFAIRD